MLTVFPAHAPTDDAFASELGTFLEAGGNVVCCHDHVTIEPGRDLLTAAEFGRSADVLLLLLSPASNLPHWSRERWEPLLLGNPAETGTHVAVFLLDECSFPALLRRGSGFFDASAGEDKAVARLQGLRRLKRWLRGIERGTSPAMHHSQDLEGLYRLLADQPGSLTVSGAMADRFAREALHDFEAVLWIPSHGRTLAQITGEIGAQMQLTLDGQVEENCRRIHDELSAKRYLLVLDAPQLAPDSFLPSGKTSVLFTREPVRVVAEQLSLATARGLVADSRYAEAYELLYRLLNAGVDVESCARELVWICEHWDRVDEANGLRFHPGAARAGQWSPEQLRLF